MSWLHTSIPATTPRSTAVRSDATRYSTIFHRAEVVRRLVADEAAVNVDDDTPKS